MAPTVADFIATSSLVDWHWTSWLTAILAGSLAGTIAIFVPETYPPVLLTYRAKCMRGGKNNRGNGDGVRGTLLGKNGYWRRSLADHLQQATYYQPKSAAPS